MRPGEGSSAYPGLNKGTRPPVPGLAAQVTADPAMFPPLCFLGHGWNYIHRAFTTFEIREKYVLPWSSWVYALPYSMSREEHQTPKLQDPKAGHTLKPQGRQTQHRLCGSPQIPEQGLGSCVYRAPWEIRKSQLKLPALYLGPSLRLQLQ